ncbi:hypothetical protein Y032_0143g2379 [Ancylostoma ceylanicum]|uniref:Uncharacterized protein n=2 Tax=Ancylostoma ceylanicum TaxID=53326 RepID=A0A016T316_9BILA|nr:hypothetical protein Y032_0143g2379 [Ancylostoma ceylanicum]
MFFLIYIGKPTDFFPLQKMRGILLVAAVGAALPMATLTPKMVLTRKITQLVTGFLTDAQLSRAIDIAALDIHNGKRADEIMSGKFS